VSTTPKSEYPPHPHHKPVEPIQEELLDKMVETLEGPVNTLGEKIIGSTIVLAPLSLMMTLSFRTIALFMGKERSQQ
jgi:hypothetical protein